MRKSTGLTVRKFWFSPAECVHKDPPLLSTPVGSRGGITPSETVCVWASFSGSPKASKVVSRPTVSVTESYVPP